ncbi:MAG: aminopeptidase N [Candidatus Pacearchaeota archaeon]|nr:aminopeptidase N [Candidatus Pacearchaeota archaeon]
MEEDILTRDFASKRSDLISDISYRLQISLKKKAKTYEGNCTINFTTKKKDQIVINTTAKIKKILINNEEIQSDILKITKKYLITIPKNLIKKGKNKVSIQYSSEYNHNGEGFHQFIDADKKEYIFSDFEPFKAHEMFPCFDQPDMKAHFNLEVKAPKEWKLISNTSEQSSKLIPKSNYKNTIFKQTPKISTYLFHLSAGDYHEFKSEYKKMPISVFCRQAFKKYVPVKDFFKFTEQGIQFYEKFFDFPYPFEKYDQIVVPEFNSLAMENPGCVTFSESQFPRREMTQTERSFFANVLLHEMTHMWFGDLVTMKWWNDLWLNESFADFLSYLAMTKATEFKNGWQDFYERKAWGYFQDQLPTTHPIATSARDTKEAFSNFDGISYSKGASVLKQLLFYIGEDNFRNGVRNYFKKHQWENTKLKDFLESLEKSSKIKLEKWFDSWIKTTGVNSIFPDINPGKKISSITLKQSAKNKKLRNHKTKIGLFYDSKIISFSANYKGKKTKLNLSKIVGKTLPLPNFIFLNYEDWDYARVEFDKISLKYILSNFSKIKHDLTKQMILGSLWEMTRDAKLNPKTMLELIIKCFQEEKSLHTLENQISYISGILTHYLSDKDYAAYSERIYQISYSKFKNKKTPKEHKNAWFSSMVLSAQAIKNIENFRALLKINLDQDKRWSILKILAARNDNEIESLIKKELKKDNTDEGKKQAAQVESAMIKNKRKYWEIFINEKGHSLDYIRGAMAPFWLRTQKEKMINYIDEFFKEAIKIYKTKSEHYGKFYSAFLFPSLYPTQEMIIKSKHFLKQNPKMPKLLRKSIIEKIDGLERINKVRKKYD